MFLTVSDLYVLRSSSGSQDHTGKVRQMALRQLFRSSAPALLGIGLLFGTACVEPFGGSNIQFTLAGSVHVPGTPSDFGRPPPSTHYEFYSLDIDSDGREFAVEIAEFDVRPVIERASPCFIEDEESIFPGLHSTRFVDKLAAEFGFNRGDFDAANPPAGMSPGDVIDYLTAEVRENNQGRLQGAVKAVTSHSPAQYGEEDWVATTDPCETNIDCAVGDGQRCDQDSTCLDIGDTCVDDDDCDGARGETCNAGGNCEIEVFCCEQAICAGDAMRTDTKFPPPYCLDDASSDERSALCEEFWAANPDRYEGSDLVFTLPLNGGWIGAVDGSDPRNNQFLGGAGLFVDANLEDIEGLLMNWQYNCDVAEFNTDSNTCEPDYPDTFEDVDKSVIGFHYMSGTVQNKTRGVINVPMINRTFGTISGQAAIWFNLDDDDVQF